MSRPQLGHRRGAFTLVELAIALAIVGLLASVAGSSYLRYIERARVIRAVAEIHSMGTLLSGLMTDEHFELPDSLADIDEGGRLDPWGNPYQYLKIAGELPPGMSSVDDGLPDVAAAGEEHTGGHGGGSPAIANARKDRFLVPINSDYDLFSIGADGKSKPALQNPDSRDDVVRAGNGAYIGLAELY